MADLEEPCPLYGIEEQMRLKCDGACFFFFLGQGSVVVLCPPVLGPFYAYVQIGPFPWSLCT